MVSYNIGHLAYLNAKRYGLPRVLFGGFFIRGHPYTMETISFAIKFWSKATLQASKIICVACLCIRHATTCSACKQTAQYQTDRYTHIHTD